MIVDTKTLQPFIDDRYISVQKHPDFDLYIYNYTQKCQFEKKWTPETKMCRGLILDGQGKVIARPFDKFFNQDEEPGIVPTGSFTAWDKLDGSLGILYVAPDGSSRIATRGSFTGEQAISGTEMVQKKVEIGEINPYVTYLFEIIYPENRIVVDYGKERKLVLLGMRVIDTGEMIAPDMILGMDDFEHARPISDFKTPRDNSEGVVLWYDNGYMVKVKYEEYKRLHRLVTGVNAKTIWELMKNRQSFDDLLDRVPDEFMDWVKETRKKLNDEYIRIADRVYFKVAEVEKLPNRKEQALSIMKDSKDISGAVFAALDGKGFDDIVWKMIRPKAEKPYKEQTEAFA